LVKLLSSFGLKFNLRRYPKYRSLMNVPFTFANADFEKKFFAEAQAAGLESLKGHRSVGRGLHSFPSQLKIEPFPTKNTP
jgi:hypothetical protein